MRMVLTGLVFVGLLGGLSAWMASRLGAALPAARPWIIGFFVLHAILVPISFTAMRATSRTVEGKPACRSIQPGGAARAEGLPRAVATNRPAVSSSTAG